MAKSMRADIAAILDEMKLAEAVRSPSSVCVTRAMSTVTRIPTRDFTEHIWPYHLKFRGLSPGTRRNSPSIFSATSRLPWMSLPSI